MIPNLLVPRVLRKHWGLAAVAVVSLSIAMALGVLSLSVSNTLLLLPPAAPKADRLVMIHERSASQEIDKVSYPDYEFYRERNQVFTDIAAAPNSVSIFVDLNFEGKEARVVARPVSANYFDVLGIRPYLGRFFSAGDDKSRPQTVIMTYACWQRLGSDPRIVGKHLGANTIIGVAPPDFTGSFYGLNGDLLTPLDLGSDTSWLTKRSDRRLFLLARLKPGANKRQAQTAMTGLSNQLAVAYPVESKNRTAVVARATLLPPDALSTAELADSILLALTLLVLLIACANVANLLLALAVGRRQETAIKLALGAPRWRLILDFLRESAVLCVISACLGYGLAAWTIRRFSNFNFEFPGYGSFFVGLNLRLDGTVLGFALLLVAMTSVAAGLAPSLYASSPDIAGIMSGEVTVGSFRKNARRNALVVVQIAVCTLVLIGLGLCQRNLYNLRHADVGFSARNLVANTAFLKSQGYDETGGKEMYRKLRQAVAELPGVESVALALNLPLSGGEDIQVQPPDGGKKVRISRTVVDADYFSTIGLPLLQGRVFNSGDRENGLKTLIVNKKMAETFWPGQDPIGKEVRAGEPAAKFAIVGVVADSKYDDLDEPRQPFMYYPLSQHYQDGISVIARTRADPHLWIEPLNRALFSVGVKTVAHPVTFERWLNLLLLPQRISAGIVAALSALGLLLAVIGLSSAVAYSVSQRKRELGIRTALGAQRRQLLRMILRQALPIAGLGIGIGVLLGVGATILLRSQFYQVGVVEWIVLLPVSAAMLAISLGSAYLSAAPWIRVDPMEAVRHT